MAIKPAMNKDVMTHQSSVAQPAKSTAAGRWLNPVSVIGIGKKSKGKI